MRPRERNLYWHKPSVSAADRQVGSGYKSCVIWFTGLSAAGKSTLANALANVLHRAGITCYVLDGDNIRHGLNRDLGFSGEDRAENIRRIGEVAKLFVDAGLIVMAAVISPCREDREYVRWLLGHGEFIEVYVKCRLTECERRDPKGIYRLARSGRVTNFTGISAPYEKPLTPDVLLETDVKTPDECLSILLNYLMEKGYIENLNRRFGKLPSVIESVCGLFCPPGLVEGYLARSVHQQLSLMAEGKELAVHPPRPTVLPPAGSGRPTPARQRWMVRRSFLVHTLNAVGGIVSQATLASLEEGALLKAARRRAGHDDFGDASFREPLRRLVSALQTEAHLHPLGLLATRHDLIRLLVNRLRLQEDRRRHPGIVEQQIRQPIIITGLPRTGTTLLHGLLGLDPANRIPRTWETMYPSPPPEAQTYHVDRRIAMVDRQIRWFHRMVRDFNCIHPVGARLPEECLVIFSHSFMSYQFETTHRLPSYLDWLESQDLRRSYEMHRRFLQHLQWRCPRERWVLKAPAHMFDFEAMFAAYPDACVVMTHRDPIEVIASNASLTATLRCAFSDDVDPVEVGRECSRRWAEALRRALCSRDLGCAPSERFLDLYYTDLVADPVAAVEKVYRHFDLLLPDGLLEKVEEFVNRNPKNRFGKHRYNLHDFGLDLQEEQKRYAAYRERFRL